MSASISAIAAWVLLILQDVGAARPKGVQADYPSIANAIAEEAVLTPLYEGDAAFWRSAALVTAIMEKESGFDHKAVNGEGGAQIGLCQVHEINLKFLGLTSKDDLLDIRKNTHACFVLAKRSFTLCQRAKKTDETWWLGPFASGRESCEWGIAASKVRVLRGGYLFQHYALADEG